MNSEQYKADGDKHASHEKKGDNPSHDRGNVLSKVFHDLLAGSLIQNIVCGIAIGLILLLAAYLLNKSLRGLMIGAGIGMTIIFWVIWLTLIEHVTPARHSPPTNELDKSASTPLNVPKASSPPGSPVPTETPRVRETPTATPSPSVMVTPTPPSALATPTLEPTSGAPYVSNDPNEVARKLQGAKKQGTSLKVRNDLVQARMRVDWKLLLFDAEYTNDNTQISAFFIWKSAPDAPTTSLMVSFKLPVEGHGRLPLRDRYFEFRVEGFLYEVTVNDVVHLKEVRITPDQ